MGWQGIWKIYVIHWSVLAKRKKNMLRRLNDILPQQWKENNLVAFVDQYDSDTVSMKVVTCFSGPFASTQRKGQFSVSLKHHVAYHDMTYHQYVVTLIVEDDVSFDPSILQFTSVVLRGLPEGWSNCFISACLPVSCREVVCLQPRGSGSNCAFGYLVSLNGSKLMLDHLPLRTTPDCQMNYVSKSDSRFQSYNTKYHRMIFEAPDETDGMWKAGKQGDFFKY
mmetsp:Transcript_50791/g.158715  ORF Transcript_50791/g.158715 Transcript_50791/m.158715 type:complete len:223 (-) Transcript_50791:862-1530(-)